MKAYRFILAALFLVLASCSQTPSPVGSDEELTSQGILSGTSGFVYYLAHNPTAADPYRVFRHDQATDARIKVYSGVKEIQSVAGTLDGGTVFVSMRESSSSSSDFEIFRIISANSVTNLTNNTMDDTNISVSRGGSLQGIPTYTMVWESQWLGSGVLSRHVVIQPNFGEAKVVQGNLGAIQPTISGNSRYVIYVEKFIAQPSNGQRIMLYDVQSKTTTQVVSNGSSLIKPSFFDPSTCDDASKVVYLTKLITGIETASYSIKLYNRTTNTVSTIVSGAEFSHPHLSADCKWLTYAQNVNGAFRIKTRNLVTNLETDSTAPASPVNHYAPFWQKANP